jgi:membrane protein YqaA with SNARE-associated domain
MDAWITWLLAALALPKFGLSSIFIICFVSATLLPLGSEPVVFGLVKLNPDLFWPAMAVATAGNTLGGAVTWWMGYGAEQAFERVAHKPHESTPGRPQGDSPPSGGLTRSGRSGGTHHTRVLTWLKRFGPKACLLSWLPLVGDPLCAVAGWLKLPFWPCLGFMAIGKFARYLTLTAFFLWMSPGALVR